MHSLRHACVLALGPALVLGAAAPAAFAGPVALPAAGAVGTAAAADPVQPGVWGGAAEVAAAGEGVIGLHTRADGALIGLRGRATDPAAGVRTLTTMVRPAGASAWTTRQLTTKAYGGLIALSPQGEGSFVASWLEAQDGGQYLLKAATLAPGATTWSAVTTVTTFGPSTIAPQVFGSATGRLMAVWGEDLQGDGIQLRITERATPGGEWSQPRIFDSVKDTDREHGGEWYLTGLAAAVDRDGNAAVVWNLDDMQRDAPPARSAGAGTAPADSAPAPGASSIPIEYHSRIMELPAGTAEWGQAQEPAPLAGTGPGWLRLDAQPAGGFSLVWNHIGYWAADRAIRYSRKPAPGADWTAPEATPFKGTDTPRALPRPLIGPNGDVTLVAAPHDGRRLLSATRDAATGTWSLDQADGRAVSGISADIAPDGTVHAAWSAYRGNGSYSYVHAFRTRDGWSAPKALETTPAGTVQRPVHGLLAVTGSRPAAVWSAYGTPLRAASGTTRPTPRFRDFSDDRRADVLSLTGDTLTRYEGDGAGHLTKGSVHTGSVTTGWAAGTRFTAFGDLNGDRLNDVLAVLPGGEARMYRTPAGRLPAPTSPYTKTGADWRGYDVLTAPGDLTGDGRADLLAREKATGNLYVLPGNGTAGFAPRVKVGPGWNAYTKVIGAGDLNGDGRGDVLARDTHGELWRYYGTGTGKLGPRALVFRDWGSTYKQVIGAGDLNGDGRADLFSTDSAGVGWLNPGTGRGTFGNRVKVSSTWATRTIS